MKPRHVLQYIHQHFKVKLIATLSVIIIVCSLVTGYVSYRIYLNLFETEISKQYLNTSEQSISQIGSKIQDMYRITDFIFFHPLVEQIVQNMQAAPTAGESKEFKTYLLERDLADILLPLKNETSQIKALYIVDLEGNNYYFSHANPSFQITFPDFYTKVKSGLKSTQAEIVWQRLMIPDSSERSGEKNSLVAARLLKSTKQQTAYGMLIMIIDDSFLEDPMKPLMAGRTTGAYLYDQYNQLLYSREPDSKEAFIPEWQNREGTFIQKNHGNEYLFVKSKYEPRSFTLVSGISLADIKEKGQRVYQVAILSGLVSVLLMAVSVSFFSGRLLKPLHMLVKAMQQIRKGNLQVEIVTTSKDEFAFLADSFNTMVANIQALIQEVYVSKLSEKEAELKALQAQLNPHFLHNALNSIYWKIMLLYDDAETASLVTSLSELLRYSLASISTPSTLQDELAQVRNYITIQEARHGEGLHVHIEAHESLTHCRMQRLLLQPLVENVFVHAFRDQTDDKRLSIRAFRQGADMQIEIEDNGCGIHPDTIRILNEDQSIYDPGRERESIGVRNVMRRIYLVHGGDPYKLEIESLERGTRLRLTLPCEDQHSAQGGTLDESNPSG
ncbi:two-component system, sensor histidine kinase YesM [Paenibacillus sp. yr247]|uniref:sensor histidine kinase n=1 Tax=Paenibacillus sp. yr247 TaxID=1761880 RepID=UPI00087F58BD|nr:histidine kinase [Paenibacillus sp. yr247]SDO34687.1 two-component system, sensor histidine kinase YesM [Paenibacillus sp. yr247]